MKPHYLIPLFLILASNIAMAVNSPKSTAKPMEIKVVIVTLFERGKDIGDDPGEFQFWVEREKLNTVIPFPQGYRDLRTNGKGVLGIVTGIGTAKAAASIMALGMDPRFDLRKAYWIVAGIGGGDPADISVGSAALAEWIVDGDLSHQIDIREAPKDWAFSIIPLRKNKPFELPVKDPNEGEVYHLNAGLVEWAYQLTKDTPLEDTEGLKKKRAFYEGYPNAQKPPFVMKGDNIASQNFWHGKILTDWANQWVKYWTGGKGNFVTAAMEDTGVQLSLSFLEKAGRVDRSRVISVRGVSNYSMQWPGATAIESLSGEKIGAYSAFLPALEAAYRVGSRILHKIESDWPQMRDHVPSAEPKKP